MKYSVLSIKHIALFFVTLSLCHQILCHQTASADVVGFPVKASGSTEKVGLVNPDGSIKYFIPFTASASGVYAVSGNGTVGTVTDSGSPGGNLRMYLAFGPLTPATGNSVPQLTFNFDDLDLNGANDNTILRETIRITGPNGSTQVIDSTSDDTADYSVTGNTSTQSIVFSNLSAIANLTNQPYLFLQVDFATLHADGGNTAEQFKATLKYVCANDPNKQSPGICGCGVPDTDSDGDGVANCVDQCPLDRTKVTPGTCGCGSSDADSDGDHVADCSDQCPNDATKVSPGVCGCGAADADANANGIIDCIDVPGNECTGRCYDGYPDLDEDHDGVSNCVEIEDGTDGCDRGSFKERLSANACAGPNGFFGQTNVLTIINHQIKTSLKARVEYRDLSGKLQKSLKIKLPPEARRDLIVNELGLKRDSYGTACVYTDATKAGLWSGGLTLYKEHYVKGSPLKGLSPTTKLDYALYYALTNPITGKSTVSLNTNSLGTNTIPGSMVANWVRLTDATPRDGKRLVGTLYYYDTQGKQVGKHKVSLPDGGRYDFPAHEPLKQRAVGLAEFIPANLTSKYYLESSRYVYEGPFVVDGNFWTAFAIPNRQATGVPTIGKLSTTANEYAIVELINASNANVNAPFRVFSGNGATVMSKNVFIPKKGSRHIVITGNALVAGVSGSAEVSGPPESIAARTLVYRFAPSKSLLFAYAPSFLEQGGSVQRSQFNSYIGNQNTLEMTNTTDHSISAEVKLLNYNAQLLKRFTVKLDAQGTKRIKLTPPANTYGTVVVDSKGVTGLVIRNDVSRLSDYTLSFPGN